VDYICFKRRVNIHPQRTIINIAWLEQLLLGLSLVSTFVAFFANIQTSHSELESWKPQVNT